MARLKILHVAAEAHPLIKTGGLADVAGALPAALVAQGADARLLLPAYPAVLAAADGVEAVGASIGAAFGAARVALLRARMPGSGLPLYLIDAPWLYGRAGNPYVDPDGLGWADNHLRFGLLGWIAAQLSAGGLDPEWAPDVVHAHDWHAGLAPVYLREHPATRARSVFTIHNLAFQGRFAQETAVTLGLPAGLLTPQLLEFHGDLSFMKGGLICADRVTTVSPTYAREILTPEYGEGLEGVIRTRGAQLSGILNGVDTDHWNPATDMLIAHTYDAQRITGKTTNKRVLRAELGLDAGAHGPLFAVVSRLVGQKGLDLLLHAAPGALARGAQLAVLGSGERSMEAAFTALASHHPGQVAVRIGFDEGLSHRFFAGADAVIVPSRFEPCGLTQLYGLRYGTPPVVRRAGGLADTVIDEAAGEGATGFVFDEPAAPALAAALMRAIDVFEKPRRWRALMRAGMQTPVSWAPAARAYLELYDGLLRTS